MLDKGHRNSTRGMVYILQQIGMLTASNTNTGNGRTNIDLGQFPFIAFLCRLMEKEILFVGSCDCGINCKRQQKEQIKL